MMHKIKSMLLTLLVFSCFAHGMNVTHKSLSEAEKKSVLEQLRKKLRNECSDRKWPLRKERMRKAIVEDSIHPDAIESVIFNNPLCDAVGRSDVEFVQFLLNNGASVQCAEKIMGSSLLHKAKTVKIAQLLVNAGASVDVKKWQGESALQAVAQDPRFEPALITFYGKKGIDSEVVDGSGCTALMDIVGDDLHDITARTCEKVRRLINIGVSVDARVNDLQHRYHNLTALQIVKKRLLDNDPMMKFSLPQTCILAVKARNKNLNNLLGAHITRDPAGIVLAYCEDGAQLDKDLKELEDVLHNKYIFT